MEMQKESSFVREVENRLGVLFGEDEKKPEQKDTQKEPSQQIHESLKDVGLETEADANKRTEVSKKLDLETKPDSEKGSSFVREIEQRLNILFGDDSKAVQPEASIAEHESLKELADSEKVSEEKVDKEEKFEQVFGDISASTSILYSPIKELKSLVLSLEWEIAEPTLIKFDEEIIRLESVYENDKVILGFLRILRFLGRYIQVKVVDADPGSILLLMSVYDNLEKVLLSHDITPEGKRNALLEDIKKYKEWVEKADLAESAEDEAAVEDEQQPELAMQELQDQEEDYLIAEPLALSKKIKVRSARKARSVIGDTAEEGLSTADIIEDMAPHEAFAYALDEIKKTIRAEFSALRAELKMWRQGQ